MKNERLKFLESFVGKPFTKSPSPLGQWLQGTVIKTEEKSVEFQFTVREEMANPVGMLHGGITSAMIDECMGVTFSILGLDFFYPTVSLNVDFFSAARVGDKVNVRTEVVKQGKTIINLKAEVFNADRKLLAQAVSNLAVSNIPMKM